MWTIHVVKLLLHYESSNVINLCVNNLISYLKITKCSNCFILQHEGHIPSDKHIWKRGTFTHTIWSKWSICRIMQERSSTSFINRLHSLNVRTREEGVTPLEWKDANIITIFENEYLTECGNYGGISILSIARILLSRLTEHIAPEVFTKIPENRFLAINGAKQECILCSDDLSPSRLRNRLCNHYVSVRVKCKIYRKIVISTLLNGEETLKVYMSQVNKLHAFTMGHLRSIIFCQDN